MSLFVVGFVFYLLWRRIVKRFGVMIGVGALKVSPPKWTTYFDLVRTSMTIQQFSAILGGLSASFLE
jgi:hypothetical protein